MSGTSHAPRRLFCIETNIMNIRLIATILTLMLTMSACGAPQAPATSTPVIPAATPTVVASSTPESATATPPATPEPTSTPGTGPLIVYERSGGFAGRHDLFRIYADGRIVSEGGAMTGGGNALAPQQITSVVARIVEAGFFSLEDAYLPPNKCCDLFTYKLTIMRDGKAKTVTTMDSAKQPPALELALKEVSALTR